MANKTLNVTLLMRNDPASTWTTKNPVLSKGEIGIEIDTKKIKIGDGTTNWNSLEYSNSGKTEVKTTDPTTTDKNYELGTLWINTTNSSAFILFASSTTATWVQLATANGNVATATKLLNKRKIKFTGAVTNVEQEFDGSSDVTFNLVLANSGVTAGTYTKLTVNAKGIITAAEQISASDIPSLTLSKISDAGTSASKDIGTSAGNIPVLDSNGKLDASILPALAITDTFEVSSQSAMLALSAQKGDVAIRTDENKSYILTSDSPSTLASWKWLRTPTDTVLSVNGKTGAVTLTTTDISEGTNLYYTEARATANFNTNFATKSSAGLTDGTNILKDTDTFVLDGGNA